MLLYIIRHGDPDYEHDSLTPLGKLQAEALAKRFFNHPLDEIYSSPMGRAKETARPTCEILGKDMKIMDWCSETILHDRIKVTDESGTHWCFLKQYTDYKNNDTVSFYHNWTDADPSFARPGVREALDIISKGSDQFLAEHGYVREGCVYHITEPNDKRIAVFCHFGVGVTWLCHLLQIPPHIFWATFDLSHSSVTVLDFQNYENKLTTPRVLQMGDLSHIMAAGLPLRFNNWLDI